MPVKPDPVGRVEPHGTLGRDPDEEGIHPLPGEGQPGTRIRTPRPQVRHTHAG